MVVARHHPTIFDDERLDIVLTSVERGLVVGAATFHELTSKLPESRCLRPSVPDFPIHVVRLRRVGLQPECQRAALAHPSHGTERALPKSSLPIHRGLNVRTIARCS